MTQQQAQTELQEIERIAQAILNQQTKKINKFNKSLF